MPSPEPGAFANGHNSYIIWQSHGSLVVEVTSSGSNINEVKANIKNTMPPTIVTVERINI